MQPVEAFRELMEGIALIIQGTDKINENVLDKTDSDSKTYLIFGSVIDKGEVFDRNAERELYGAKLGQILRDLKRLVSESRELGLF